MVSMKDKKERLSKIVQDNNFVDILEKKINNSGNVYISNSEKKNLKGNSVIIVILPEEDS